MDRLQSMRVLAKVVEQGSFAGAAQMLGMSNAVVTRHVADLESHLGTRLLNRTTRRLSLTEPGQAYLVVVRQALVDIDEAEAIAASNAQKTTRTLRLYSHLGFGQVQLAQLLPLYAQAYPDVVLGRDLAGPHGRSGGRGIRYRHFRRPAEIRRQHDCAQARFVGDQPACRAVVYREIWHAAHAARHITAPLPEFFL